MDKFFIKAHFDINCEWAGITPAYRIYVNDELFAERTWRWTDCYLQEVLQIEAPPGRYRVRLEPVRPTVASFKISNHTVEHGRARWIGNTYLEIDSNYLEINKKTTDQDNESN